MELCRGRGSRWLHYAKQIQSHAEKRQIYKNKSKRSSGAGVLRIRLQSSCTLTQAANESKIILAAHLKSIAFIPSANEITRSIVGGVGGFAGVNDLRVASSGTLASRVKEAAAQTSPRRRKGTEAERNNNRVENKEPLLIILQCDSARPLIQPRRQTCEQSLRGHWRVF